jgi:hypothetical protein
MKYFPGITILFLSHLLSLSQPRELPQLGKVASKKLLLRLRWKKSKRYCWRRMVFNLRNHNETTAHLEIKIQ